MASLLHLCLVGFGGTATLELVADNPRMKVLYYSMSAAFGVFAAMVFIYFRVFRKTTKK
jgi:hypothetical protein